MRLKVSLSILLIVLGSIPDTTAQSRPGIPDLKESIDTEGRPYWIAFPSDVTENGISSISESLKWEALSGAKGLDDGGRRAELYARILLGIAARPSNFDQRKRTFTAVSHYLRDSGREGASSGDAAIDLLAFAAKDVEALSALPEAARLESEDVGPAENFSDVAESLRAIGPIGLPFAPDSLADDFLRFAILANDEAARRLAALREFIDAEEGEDIAQGFRLAEMRFEKTQAWWRAYAEALFASRRTTARGNCLPVSPGSAMAAAALADLASGSASEPRVPSSAMGMNEYRRLSGWQDALQAAVLAGALIGRLNTLVDADDGSRRSLPEIVEDVFEQAEYLYLDYFSRALRESPAPLVTQSFSNADELANTVEARRAEAWRAAVSDTSELERAAGEFGSGTTVGRDSIAFVEGGTFQMGSEAGLTGERPPHEVTLPSFFMGRYEVTQELYELVMGRNPAAFAGEGKRPVERVSWYDTAAFCNALSTMEGLQELYSIEGQKAVPDFSRNGWRLPTEAEWEFAALGGRLTRAFPFPGSDVADEVGWMVANSGKTTKAVGMKACNELGIYDMVGNVWEWCMDWEEPYTCASWIDPTGPSSGTYRALRGGGWNSGAFYCRSSYRGHATPSYKSSVIGFRISRRP